MAPKTTRQLLDERGGYRKVAEALGWPVSTVHTWDRNNDMPPYRRTIIEQLPKVSRGEAEESATKRKRAA